MNKDFVENAITLMDDQYVLEAAEASTQKVQRFPMGKGQLVKVAAAALLLICAGTASVYAAGRVLKDTNYNMEMDQMYVGGAPTQVGEDVVVEDLEYESNTISAEETAAGMISKESTKWEAVGLVPDTIYGYKFSSYDAAALYFGLDNWYGELVSEDVVTTVGHMDSSFFQTYALRLTMDEKEGSIFLSEFYSEGDVADNYGMSDTVLQMSNQREYTNQKGVTLSLVDGYVDHHEDDQRLDGKEMVTVVMIGYQTEEGGFYTGELIFLNMKEKDIQKALDKVSIPE